MSDMFFWTNPDSSVTHRIHDAGLFLQTYCGIKMSKTKTSVHTNPDVVCLCGDCTLVYERGYSHIDRWADEFPKKEKEI